jgi:hypothetical protein
MELVKNRYIIGDDIFLDIHDISGAFKSGYKLEDGKVLRDWNLIIKGQILKINLGELDIVKILSEYKGD